MAGMLCIHRNWSQVVQACIGFNLSGDQVTWVLTCKVNFLFKKPIFKFLIDIMPQESLREYLSGHICIVLICSMIVS